MQNKVSELWYSMSHRNEFTLEFVKFPIALSMVTKEIELNG